MPYNAALAVDSGGHAWGRGNDLTGALCMGTGVTQFLTPVELPLTDATAVAGPSAHSLFDSSGTLYACGSNPFGQLGDGKKGRANTSVPVVGMEDQDIKTVVASSVNSGVLLADGVTTTTGATTLRVSWAMATRQTTWAGGGSPSRSRASAMQSSTTANMAVSGALSTTMRSRCRCRSLNSRLGAGPFA
jgi:hypothetical protein